MSMEQVQAALKKLMTRKDLTVKPTKHLKPTFTDFDGSEKPLKVRYYQIQGMLHLVLMRNFVLGDDTGLGKTLEAIVALCYIWEKEPDRKVIILTTKSATKQWAGEFSKFTTGVTTFLGMGTPVARTKAREAFAASTGPTVMIMGYRSAVQDFTHLQHFDDYIMICDEATAFKNPKTQVHQVCRHMADRSARAWGLTATLIKNNLLEGYGIYQVLVPELFQMTYNQFMMYYCLVRMQKLPRSNRQIPVVIGYAKPRVLEFKDNIAPYFLGRPKYEVASELPSLLIQTLNVEMTGEQDDRYKDALDGLLEIGQKQD